MSLAPVTSPEPDSALAPLAQLLKGGGDALRLAVLQVLGLGSFGVLELCDIFGLKQPAMSHHLKVLAQAGLVSTRREGNAIFYRRAFAPAGEATPAPAGALLQALYAALDATPIPAATLANVETVREAREAASRAFFEKHADDFRERQDLIAEYRQYADGAREMLLAASLPAEATVLEVGPGHGEFLGEIATRHRHVIALDTSAELLAHARAFAAAEGHTNVEFIAGDTREALRRGLAVDAVVCNMVLHHIPSPAATFRDAALLLNPGGVMLVTELCRHEQDWVREHCGDLWQGFEDAELDDWARDAGLLPASSSWLGLRNGFQVLFRRYTKPVPAGP